MVKQAQERANEVVTSANHSAEELRSSSITYATDVLEIRGNEYGKHAGYLEEEPPELD